MAQWWEHSPWTPTKVARVRFPDVVVPVLGPRGFSRLDSPVFPSPHKPTFPNSSLIWTMSPYCKHLVLELCAIRIYKFLKKGFYAAGELTFVALYIHGAVCGYHSNFPSRLCFYLVTPCRFELQKAGEISTKMNCFISQIIIWIRVWISQSYLTRLSDPSQISCVRKQRRNDATNLALNPPIFWSFNWKSSTLTTRVPHLHQKETKHSLQSVYILICVTYRSVFLMLWIWCWQERMSKQAKRKGWGLLMVLSNR